VLADTDLDLCDTVVFRLVGICLYNHRIHAMTGLYESPLTTSTLTTLHETRIAVKCHVVGSEAHVQHRFTSGGAARYRISLTQIAIPSAYSMLQLQGVLSVGQSRACSRPLLLVRVMSRVRPSGVSAMAAASA